MATSKARFCSMRVNPLLRRALATAIREERITVRQARDTWKAESLKVFLANAERAVKKHNAETARPKCGRCAGTGMFVTGTINGKPNTDGSTCYRCNGKGYLTARDRDRNWGYDNFYARAH